MFSSKVGRGFSNVLRRYSTAKMVKPDVNTPVLAGNVDVSLNDIQKDLKSFDVAQIYNDNYKDIFSNINGKIDEIIVNQPNAWTIFGYSNQSAKNIQNNIDSINADIKYIYDGINSLCESTNNISNDNFNKLCTKINELYGIIDDRDVNIDELNVIVSDIKLELDNKGRIINELSANKIKLETNIRDLTTKMDEMNVKYSDTLAALDKQSIVNEEYTHTINDKEQQVSELDALILNAKLDIKKYKQRYYILGMALIIGCGIVLAQMNENKPLSDVSEIYDRSEEINGLNNELEAIIQERDGLLLKNTEMEALIDELRDNNALLASNADGYSISTSVVSVGVILVAVGFMVNSFRK